MHKLKYFTQMFLPFAHPSYPSPPSPHPTPKQKVTHTPPLPCRGGSADTEKHNNMSRSLADAHENKHVVSVKTNKSTDLPAQSPASASCSMACWTHVCRLQLAEMSRANFRQVLKCVGDKVDNSSRTEDQTEDEAEKPVL